MRPHVTTLLALITIGLPLFATNARANSIGYDIQLSSIPEFYPCSGVQAPTSSAGVVVESDTYTISHRAGAVVPATRGQYVKTAKAAAWYKVISSGVGWPTLEFRYFVYDVVQDDITRTFSINYQHQPIGGNMGVLREWEYSSAMPINYQLGENEILGFYTTFHTHGGGGRYVYEYHYGSLDTPTSMAVTYQNNQTVLYYAGTASSEVPEPATMLAGLAGLAGVGRYLRERNRHKRNTGM